ncbi:hypothetical protein Tco_0433448, partial [Tanacetum coccineum]
KVLEIAENSEARNVDSKLNEKLIKDSKSDVEGICDKTGIFMASNHKKNRSRVRKKSLYERWKEPLCHTPPRRKREA